MKCRAARFPGTILGMALLAVALPSWAQDCFDYRDFRPFESEVNVGADAVSLSGFPPYAFLADASDYVHTIDCSDPLAPFIVTSRFFQDLNKFAVVDSFAFAASSSPLGEAPSFDLFKIQSDASLTRIGNGRLETNVYFSGNGFAVYNDLVFVLGYRALGSGAIFIYRMEGGGLTPIDIAGAPPSNYDIVRDGNHLYVTSSRENVYWLEFAEDGAITQTGFLDFATLRAGVVIEDGLMYAVSNTPELLVVDITNPDSPSVLGSCYLGGSPSRFSVGEDIVYVADGSLGLREIDVSDPHGPRIEKTTYLPGGATHVIAADPYVAVASQKYGMRVVDPNGNYPSPFLDYSLLPGRMMASKGHWLLTYTVPNLNLFDVLDGLPPSATETFLLMDAAIPGFITFGEDVAVLGHMYGWDDNLGTILVTPPGPTGPRETVTLRSAEERVVWGAAIHEGHVFLAEAVDDTTNCLRVLDISDPWHPALVSELPLADGWIKKIKNQGHHVILSYSNADLVVVDVAVPSVPSVTANVSCSAGRTSDFALGDGFVCLATSSGLWTVGYSLPDSVTYSCQYNPGKYYTQVEIAGNIVYAHEFYSNLIAVFDATDPCNLVELGLCLGTQSDFEVVGDRVFLGTSRSIVTLKAQCPLDAGQENPTSGTPPSDGLDAAGQAGLLGASVGPNPFNALTEVQFSIPNNQHVQVTVYDLKGNQIIVLEDRDYAPGTYRVPWNARDEAGRTVPTGMYMIRLEAGGESQTVKALLLK
ncbi:T9SS type A sorting domain-containing protein [bacterium]|nr:T9SS type A sorting domain-containing protein [bacterium]